MNQNIVDQRNDWTSIVIGFISFAVEFVVD